MKIFMYMTTIRHKIGDTVDHRNESKEGEFRDVEVTDTPDGVLLLAPGS